MQFQVEFKGKKKPAEFYFPSDKPIKAYQEYLADKSKNFFVGTEGGFSITLDFSEVVMIVGAPDFKETVTVPRT